MATASKPIRKAATVLVVRDGAADLEVFMVQRPGRGVFPNLHVFPGGKVEGGDHGLDHLCRELTDAEASAALGLAHGGLRYWVTAIRECFEECGVLLAYRDGALFQPRDDAEETRFDAYRNQLIGGDIDLPELARREELVLATDRVHYFSHWITPESAPARFRHALLRRRHAGRTARRRPSAGDRRWRLGRAGASTGGLRRRTLADDPPDVDDAAHRGALPHGVVVDCRRARRRAHR